MAKICNFCNSLLLAGVKQLVFRITKPSFWISFKQKFYKYLHGPHNIQISEGPWFSSAPHGEKWSMAAFKKHQKPQKHYIFIQLSSNRGHGRIFKLSSQWNLEKKLFSKVGLSELRPQLSENKVPGTMKSGAFLSIIYELLDPLVCKQFYWPKNWEKAKNRKSNSDMIFAPGVYHFHFSGLSAWIDFQMEVFLTRIPKIWRLQAIAVAKLQIFCHFEFKAVTL